MRRWFFPLLAAGIVVLAGWLFYQVAWVASRGGVGSPLYSAERYDPYGVAALYRLLQQQGLSVNRLQRPDLSQVDSGVLIQIVPSADDSAPVLKVLPSEEGEPQVQQEKPVSVAAGNVEMNPYALSEDEILEWVSQGNVLVQLSHTRTHLMDLAGVPLTDATVCTFSGHKIETLQRSGAAPDLLPQASEAKWTEEAKREYGLGGAGPLLHSPLVFTDEGGRAGWTPLLKVGDQVVAGQIRYGRGRVVVIGAPTPALNVMLGQGGNLPLMLKFAGEGPVIFDAWSHEPGHAGSLMGLVRQFGLLPLLLQLMFLMLVYHWSTLGRRRELLPEADRPRSSVEQIQTLGYLYNQAMEPPVAAIRIAREVHLRVAKGLSCSVEKIARRLEQSDLDPARASQAKELLAAADALTSHWPGCCNHCGHDFKTKPVSHCPGCGLLASPPPVTSAVAASNTHQAQKKHPPELRDMAGELSRLLTLSHAFATGKKL